MPDSIDNNSKNKNNKILLGFDFGLKQIGIAVGDTLTGTARPLKILTANDGMPRWEQVQQDIEEWKPEYLVVGLPLNMDGSESDMSTRARKFANRLHGRFGLQVELQDERLSSREARTFLADDLPVQASKQSRRQTIKKNKRPAHNQVDAVAAAIILESWLRSLENN